MADFLLETTRIIRLVSALYKAHLTGDPDDTYFTLYDALQEVRSATSLDAIQFDNAYKVGKALACLEHEELPPDRET